MNTGRKHPRTLAEAFPGGAEYACAVERPDPTRRVLRLIFGLVGVLLGVVLGLHLFFII